MVSPAPPTITGALQLSIVSRLWYAALLTLLMNKSSASFPPTPGASAGADGELTLGFAIGAGGDQDGAGSGA